MNYVLLEEKENDKLVELRGVMFDCSLNKFFFFELHSN